MPTSIRLMVFAGVVALIAVTIAPPVRSSARVERQHTSPAPVDSLLGTYAGTITADTPGDMPDGGTIVLRRDGVVLVVTAGPDAGTQLPSEKVARTERGVSFEVTLPGEPVSVLRFDLAIDGPAMTGAIVAVIDGRTMNGRLAFARQ
jgi:hypothetical protein